MREPLEDLAFVVAMVVAAAVVLRVARRLWGDR